LLIGCIIKKLVTMSTIDFVSLVEKNPLTQLSGTYQYHPIHDFAIYLDNVWKWIGFCQKYNAKRVLETFFVLDKDYKCLLHKLAEQTSEGSQPFRIICTKNLGWMGG